MTPLLVDVDTGVDDALALALLVRRAPDLTAVTTVAGNTVIDNSTENSRRVLAWLGKATIPVHRGASRPLAVPYLDAAQVHGDNGLGNVDLPPSDQPEAATNAVQMILETAEQDAGDLTVLTLGPLTNLAIALSLRPALVQQIGRLVVMGGALFTSGNITAHAEFNVYADPHAAAQVLGASWRDVTVIGLDVTHRTVLSRAVWQSIGENRSPAAELARRILERTFAERNAGGLYLHDPLAALVTLEPETIRGERGGVDVILDGVERGRTIFHPGNGRVLIAREVDAAAERAICSALDIPWVSDASAWENAE